MEKPLWYPQDKDELNSVLDKFLAEERSRKRTTPKNIHGLIVPHAGYFFSGELAGKAFALLKNKKIKKAIILGPSHYIGFYGLMSFSKVETPLGKVEIIDDGFENLKKIRYEHSLDNQFPFLQKLNSNIEILPLIVGEFSEKGAEEVAQKISELENENTVYIFSTDLSHFLSYEEALKRDKKTIEIIKNLDVRKFSEINACGKIPILIMMHLCKIKGWIPSLIEYKNSGDITGEKDSVVGYATFYF